MKFISIIFSILFVFFDDSLASSSNNINEEIEIIYRKASQIIENDGYTEKACNLLKELSGPKYYPHLNSSQIVTVAEFLIDTKEYKKAAQGFIKAFEDRDLSGDVISYFKMVEKKEKVSLLEWMKDPAFKEKAIESLELYWKKNNEIIDALGAKYNNDLEHNSLEYPKETTASSQNTDLKLVNSETLTEEIFEAQNLLSNLHISYSSLQEEKYLEFLKWCIPGKSKFIRLTNALDITVNPAYVDDKVKRLIYEECVKLYDRSITFLKKNEDLSNSGWDNFSKTFFNSEVSGNTLKGHFYSKGQSSKKLDARKSTFCFGSLTVLCEYAKLEKRERLITSKICDD